MLISLNKYSWELKGFWPCTPLLHRGMELGNEMMGVTDWLDATVPGGVHYDLLKAGLIEDPYYELNSLKCEWVENRWWMYKTVFRLENNLNGKHFELIFKGVDYKAHFYLNGNKLGVHEGMFESVNFSVDDVLNMHDENELIVILENAPWEVSQIGYTSQTKTQKSRFNYKWDFGTRLVNIGLWDDVLLRVTGDIIIDNVRARTSINDGCGIINVCFNIDGIADISESVEICVENDDEKVACWEGELGDCLADGKVCKEFYISSPKVWYPNGLGDQPLYRITIKVYDHDELSDQRELYVGIRNLEYRQNVNSPSEAFPYTFVLNDKPIYIKGVNLTPLDHLYGNVTREDYEKVVHLLQKANINMVRVWGGGIIEKEYFYHLCDTHGILVWQEFIQSSSGIENVPSTDPHFLELLKKTALNAVKQKRNHVCHTVWSGGNELMDTNNVPITNDHPNIKMLKEIVEEFDYGKLFLPSSASGPNEFLDTEKPGLNHDVHGNWKYEGVEKHYLNCNHSDSLFNSEFGVDGCSSVASMNKFLGREHLKVTDMTENLVWRHHGEWWDTKARDEDIFGTLDNLDDFVLASQFIQAEGIRYIIESNRRRKFVNSGSIIWQFNEPWPNISCTSLVEYHKRPKMAYYWVCNSYEPVHVSFCYDKLVWKEGEQFTGSIFLNNSLSKHKFKISWKIKDAFGVVLLSGSKKADICSNSVQKIKKLMHYLPKIESEIFFVQLEVKDSNGNIISENIYLFSQKEKNPFSSLIKFYNGKYTVHNTSNGVRIKNVGNVVVPFIHGVAEDDGACILIKDNYTTLFPGEERVFRVDSIGETNTKNISIVWKTFQCNTQSSE